MRRNCPGRNARSCFRIVPCGHVTGLGALRDDAARNYTVDKSRIISCTEGIMDIRIKYTRSDRSPVVAVSPYGWWEWLLSDRPNPAIMSATQTQCASACPSTTCKCTASGDEVYDLRAREEQ